MEESAAESRGNDVGLLLRLAFNGLVIGLVLFGFVEGVVLAATGDSSGPRRVSGVIGKLSVPSRPPMWFKAPAT